MKTFLKILLSLSAVVVLLTANFSSASAQTVVDTRVGCFIFTDNLRYGDGAINTLVAKNAKISKVIELQDNLIKAGYMSGKATGYFGPATLRAVKAYQKAKGISPTGFVGEKTRGVLRSEFCTKPPIAMCDYAAPPEGCTYMPGPDYNAETSCGMKLSCGGVSSSAPENCKIWYDGCNTCSRQQAGGHMMCTMMACMTFTQNTPYCKEYFK